MLHINPVVLKDTLTILNGTQFSMVLISMRTLHFIILAEMSEVYSEGVRPFNSHTICKGSLVLKVQLVV